MPPNCRYEILGSSHLVASPKHSSSTFWKARQSWKNAPKVKQNYPRNSFCNSGGIILLKFSFRTFNSRPTRRCGTGSSSAWTDFCASTPKPWRPPTAARSGPTSSAISGRGRGFGSTASTFTSYRIQDQFLRTNQRLKKNLSIFDFAANPRFSDSCVLKIYFYFYLIRDTKMSFLCRFGQNCITEFDHQ